MSSRQFYIFAILYMAFATLIIAPSVRAVTPATSKNAKPHKRQPVSYIRDIGQLKSSLHLQLSAVSRTLAIPDNEIALRLTNPKRDPRIEPLQLTVPPDDDRILALAAKLSKPGKKLALAHFISENLSQGEVVPGSDLKLVSLNPQSMELINRSELDQMFAKDHSQLYIQSKDLKKNATLRSQLLNQLSAYLSPQQIQNVRKKIDHNQQLKVDEDLLPKFARDRVKSHTVFKGPNCFHAALSFQSSSLSESPNVNVREEPGYHRDMINYDELWRVVQLEFYEINPAKTDLQYGDMILFFDTPKEAAPSIDFRTLRHAATYLFGGYAFAKGSKSANSPYLIRPVTEEWNTWVKYTENLGAKVYRRNLRQLRDSRIWDPQDWMY